MGLKKEAGFRAGLPECTYALYSILLPPAGGKLWLMSGYLKIFALLLYPQVW